MRKFVVLFVFFMLSLFFLACSDEGRNSISEKEESVLSISMQNLEGASLDSIVVLVQGSDFSTQRQVWSIDELSEQGEGYQLEVRELPPGTDRLLEVQAWGFGILLFQGSELVDLVEGEMPRVELTMLPQTAALLFTVSLGTQNPWDIQGGSLRLVQAENQYTTPLVLAIPQASFELDYVPYGEYAWHIVLWDSAQDTIFSGSDQVLVDAQSAELNLQLQSLLTGLKIELSFNPSGSLAGNVLLAGSVKRSVQGFGEIFLSEFMANPKVSGTDYEWFELYNATLDTLLLDSCALAKSISSTTATTYLEINAELAPGGFYVWGRDSVHFADSLYQDFTLSNTGQSLFLFCGDMILDSLFYHSRTDSLNPFPLDEGHSLELDLGAWQSRLQGSSWVPGVDSIDDSWMRGTPGAY
jgi:hypothetical protein